MTTQSVTSKEFKEPGDQSVSGRSTPWKPVQFDQLPQWLQGNAYIRSDHRPQLSWGAAARSMFAIHSETANAWSHFVPALVYVVLQIRAVICNTDTPKETPLHAFRLAAILCFSSSTMFHLLQCVSADVFRRLAKLDYPGIILFMSAAGYAWIRTAPGLTEYGRDEYAKAIARVSATVVLYIIFADDFCGPSQRATRVVLFVSYGCCGVIPAYHVFKAGACGSVCFSSKMAGMICSFLIGVALYATRLPERFIQRRLCHLVFQSHTLFHVAVIAGSWFYYSILADISAMNQRVKSGI